MLARQTPPQVGPAPPQPAPDPITPDSIAKALASVSVAKSELDVTILRPWEIYELVTANTPRKKELFKELKAAWDALTAAKSKLAAAEKALAAATPAPATPAAPAPGVAKKGKKGKGGANAKKPPPDPKAVRDAAAAVVEKAEKRVAAATTAIKTFIFDSSALLRSLASERKKLTKNRADLSKTLTKEQARAKPDPAKVKAATDAIGAADKRLGEIPKAEETARAEIQKHIDAANFAPVKTTRTTYTVTVDGTAVKLSDRVEAWPTMFAEGLVEHAAGGASLRDVLSKASISESQRKILRAISANESGSAPFSSLNTYDRAVLTWGLVQWTGGKDSDLTAALTTIKKTAPTAFASRFQRYGIDVVSNSIVITKGDGTKVTGNAAATEIQGSVVLSAVLSRAGYDADIQAAEVVAAVDQQMVKPLDGTFDVERPAKATDPKATDPKAADPKAAPAADPKAAAPAADPKAKPAKPSKPEKVTLRYKDVLTSEMGVGLFADQVVNSGGPNTKSRVAAAVRKYAKDHSLDPKNVTKWAGDAEKEVIKILAPFKNRKTPFISEGCSEAAGSYKP